MKFLNSIKGIVKNYYQSALNTHESRIINEILEIDDFLPIENKVPYKIQNICFVVPEIEKHSGGITSVLRLGTYLSKLGFDVIYASFTEQNINNMVEISKYNLKDVEGSFRKLSDVINKKFDIIVATSWISVYYSKKLEGYKVYFVQDYEPYFFKLSERYLMAKKTYEQGFHIISLGNWNIEQIKKECLSYSRMDWIDFPYEPKEYENIKRDFSKYRNKRRIKIAVYSKEDGKRIPNLLQGILKKTALELKKDEIELDILFFGFESKYKPQIGKNMGKLNKYEMWKLYKECDFGMVASMTNISLVPYEMISTGLPIIEFKDGSYTYFFEDNTAILIDFNYKTLANKLKYYLSNPERLESIMINSQKQIGNLSWKHSAEQFANIIENV